jgi:hypothetical protein
MAAKEARRVTYVLGMTGIAITDRP